MTEMILLKKLIQVGLLAALALIVFALGNRIVSGSRLFIMSGKWNL